MNTNRQISSRRTDDATEFLSPEGAVVATLFDGDVGIIFDPLADLAALFGGAQEIEIANEEYFRAAGLI